MSTITQSLLIQIEPIIVEAIEKIKKFHENNDMLWTKRDEEFKRLDLTYHMLRSIITYTKSTDELGTFSVKKHKGEFELNATIIRDEIPHSLITEMIIAGGHNIQCMHYRYITKTNLKNEKNVSSIKYLQDKIKMISKIEKLEKEILYYNKMIEKNIETIKKAEQLTDEEILFDSRDWVRSNVTWEVIVERGADKNYDYDKSKFETSQKEYRQSKIDFFKKMNITMPASRNKALQKEIVKIQSKIEKLNS